MIRKRVLLALFAALLGNIARAQNTYWFSIDNMLIGDASTFDNGTMGGWEAWGSNMESAEVVEGVGNRGTSAVVLTNKGDGEYSQAQFVYTFDTPLTKGGIYIIRFIAWSSVEGGKLQFQLQNSHSGGSQCAYKEFDLRKSYYSFHEIPFVVPEFDDIDRIIINFGKVKGSYILEEIEFGMYITDTEHDGGIFIGKTAEGICMRFQVVNAKEKTCQAGWGFYVVNDDTEGCVTIPSAIEGFKVIYLGGSCFIGCNRISQLTIPESITEINGWGAFSEMDNLVSIYSYIKEPCNLEEYAFMLYGYTGYSSATLYVPKGCVEKYRAASGWNNLQNIVEMEDESPDENQLRAEYFIDTDPGYGMATTIDGADWGETSYELPLSSVSTGTHLLYVRACDENGRWSATANRPLYVVRDLDIAGMEYFFDTNDPGQGRATQVSIPTQHGNVITFEANMNGLSLGQHQLNVRTKDKDGYWSLLSSEPFTLTAQTGILTVTSDFSFNIKVDGGTCIITPSENCQRSDCRVELIDMAGRQFATALWKQNSPLFQLPVSLKPGAVILVSVRDMQESRQLVRRIIINE